MRFNSTCLITTQMEKQSRFYACILECAPQGDDSFTRFDLDGACLTLCSRVIMEEMAPGSMTGAGYGSVVLEFEVQDVDAHYRRWLDLQITVVKAPTTQPWGLRSAWARDPDGNVVNFYSRVHEHNTDSQ